MDILIIAILTIISITIVYKSVRKSLKEGKCSSCSSRNKCSNNLVNKS